MAEVTDYLTFPAQRLGAKETQTVALTLDDGENASSVAVEVASGSATISGENLSSNVWSAFVVGDAPGTLKVVLDVTTSTGRIPKVVLETRIIPETARR
jgi:hypothetical protein